MQVYHTGEIKIEYSNFNYNYDYMMRSERNAYLLEVIY